MHPWGFKVVQDVLQSHIDSIIRRPVCPVGKLQEVQQGSCYVFQVAQHQSFKGFHDHRRQGDDDGGAFEEGGHFTQLQGPVKDLCEYWRQLFSTDLHTRGGHTIRSWSLLDLLLLKEPSHILLTDCYRRRVMWPLKMSEIPSSTPSKMDGKANTFFQNWLGLPCCLSETGLFGRNTLQLPLQSISLGYKQEKTRLVLELRESADQAVKNANPKVETGWKWNAN
ncbi:uncharacterized protein LOC114572707 [Perca flavescens]|uniref:uncharacterized protein LOC114572707 n=1 Tax=Perca flavescens TaxID=8167 RepID=UPI00106EDD97|nr:uncharacterized protein LOC114572707 [Perca flavescens]XP_028460235.1 uncharacterized protein LOC114572707 [Perca flavescens]